jgi:nucleotide-binding universal stress UspA family protein
MKILLATDGSSYALDAAGFIRALPLPPGTVVQVVCVVDPYLETLLAHVRPEEASWADRVIQEALDRVRQPGVEAAGVIRTGDPAHEIINAGRELQADLVVVGSQGLSGIEGFLLGSVARNVAKHAGRPVLVARAPEHHLRLGVLAIDDSEHATRAVEWTAGFPLPAAMEIEVVTVTRPYNPYPGLVPDDIAGFRREVEAERRRRRRAALRQVRKAAERLRAAGKQATEALREGDPANEILKVAAEKEADLIIAGARGASLIEGLLVGSVADRLLKTARCSVLLVH